MADPILFLSNCSTISFEVDKLLRFVLYFRSFLFVHDRIQNFGVASIYEAWLATYTTLDRGSKAKEALIANDLNVWEVLQQIYPYASKLRWKKVAKETRSASQTCCAIQFHSNSTNQSEHVSKKPRFLENSWCAT